MEYKADFLHIPDGQKLYVQSWQPMKPMAKIVIVHGYAEHGGRYETTARVLVEQGFAVIATLYAMQNPNTALRGLMLSAFFLQQPGREDSRSMNRSRCGLIC